MTVIISGVSGKDQRPLIRHGYWNLVPRMTRQELRSRYSQSGLRLVWMVVQPMFLLGIFAIFFNGVLKVSGDDIPYLSFIACGLVPWRYFAASMSRTGAISENLFVISKVYFPREIIPIVSSTTALADLGIGMGLMFVIVWFQGQPPTLAYLAIPAALLLLVLCTMAMTIFTTVAAVFIRDLSHGMPIVLQGLFFATPIMYPPSELPDWLRWLVVVNPLSVAVTSMRSIVAQGRWPDFALLGIHLVIAALALWAALAYSRSVEHRMVDVA